MMIIFKAGASNTGACTMNVNGLGAKTIAVAENGIYYNPNSGYIDENDIHILVYDGTYFILIQDY